MVSSVLLTVYEVTTLAGAPLLLFLSVPHLFRASGIPRSRRLRPPALSLALVGAARAAPAAMELVGRIKGVTAALCTADSVLTTFLTAAAVAHLPALAFTADTRLETPTHKPRPLTKAFYAALLSAVYAFAASHAITSALVGGSQWWGYYYANASWWWRYARLSLLFPPVLALFVCLCTVSTLYAVHGNPNPRIRPTWQHWASVTYLTVCSGAVIAYLVFEAVMWRDEWWPRVFEASIGLATALPLTLNVHIWRAYGAWVRCRSPPRTQRLSFEVSAVFVNTANSTKRASASLVVDVEAALPSPIGSDPFAAAPMPPPAPREFVPILGAEVECLPAIAEDERGSKLSVMSVPEDVTSRPTTRFDGVSTTHPLSPYSARFYGSPRRSATSAASLPFVYALSEEIEDDLRRFPMDFPVSTYSDLDFSLRPPSARSVGSAYSDDMEAQSAESHHSRLRLNSKASRHVAQSSDSLSVLDLEGSVIVVSPVDRRPSMEVARIVNLSRQ